MQEIVKREIAPNMPSELRPAIIANWCEAVAKVSGQDAEGSIANSIQAAYIIVGQAVTAKVLREQVKELYSDILRKYKYFTLSEVDLALRMGAKGDLGECKMFPVMSIYNFNQWIAVYGDEIRNKALDNQRIFEEKQEGLNNLKRKMDGTQSLQAEIVNIFKAFCKGGSIDEMVSFTPKPAHLLSVYYDHMDTHELILLSIPEKRLIYKNAEEEFKKFRPEGSEFRPEVKEFDSAFPMNARILAKSMALKATFERYKAEGFEIIFETEKTI